MITFKKKRLNVKRLMDVLLATFFLLILSPFMFILAIFIRLDTPGPILFGQYRLGLNQKPFKMIKFRSMVHNHDNNSLISLTTDPRVTKVGKVIRGFSLDELPQLINILKGDMSFVGPRPAVVDELDVNGCIPQEYQVRFTALPGLTGLAQINGRNDISWREKNKLDCRYIDLYARFGIALDIYIIVCTVFVVVRRNGVVEGPDRDD